MQTLSVKDWIEQDLSPTSIPSRSQVNRPGLCLDRSRNLTEGRDLCHPMGEGLTNERLTNDQEARSLILGTGL